MTVPGLVDQADDKEKLVIKENVATIMPNRDRLTKIRKRKHVMKLIISLALILIILSSILFTFCYIKKIGPFKRIFRGICPVGTEKFGHHKVYESFEITDNYALISVPKFHVKWGLFQSVKTLHVFKKKLTVIQYNGVCFVRPMLRSQGLQKDWFEKIGRINYHDHPRKFTHIHWQLSNSPYSHDYLRKNVHEMAAAMCMSRPVFHLKFYTFNHNSRRSCFKKCEKCELRNQYIKWETVNGQNCEVCHCKTNERLKSSNHVDANCKAIRCENKCNGKKLLGCVQCKCADNDQQKTIEQTPIINGMKVAPSVGDNEETKPQAPIYEQMLQMKPDSLRNNFANSDGNGATTRPTFQNLLRQHPVYFQAGFQNRKKRSVGSECRIVAEIFEGYSPLDYGSKMAVDYIHEC